jgi:radical SAM protein with 4Fe4S-binding SPASM domain
VDVTPLKRFLCRQLEAGVSVLWSGDVILCRQDFDGRYPLGNLKNQHLEEITNGRLEEIWQAHKDEKCDKLPLCKDCKEWYYNLYG